MHGERMALSPSAWADLDALVLEEVNALDAPREARNEPPAFTSEDDFVAQAVAYLRRRDEPLRVIEDLTKELGLSMSEDLELPDDLEPPDEFDQAEVSEAPAAALPPETPGDVAASSQPGPGS